MLPLFLTAAVIVCLYQKYEHSWNSKQEEVKIWLILDQAGESKTKSGSVSNWGRLV